MCLRKITEQPSVVDYVLIDIISRENDFCYYICTVSGPFLLALLFILRSRVKIEGAGQEHEQSHPHWFIKNLMLTKWGDLRQYVTTAEEILRGKGIAMITHIIGHCSFPGLSFIPTCLERCVRSWTDPGLSSKPSNVLAAHHRGQSQGDTKSVFPCLLSLYNKWKTFYPVRNNAISNFLDMG